MLFEEEDKTVPKQKWLNVDDAYLHTLEVGDSNCDSLHEGKWELNFQSACIQGNIQTKRFDPQWNHCQWQSHCEMGVGQDSFATDRLQKGKKENVFPFWILKDHRCVLFATWKIDTLLLVFGYKQQFRFMTNDINESMIWIASHVYTFPFKCYYNLQKCIQFLHPLM